jgi:hypothetical protein
MKSRTTKIVHHRPDRRVGRCLEKMRPGHQALRVGAGRSFFASNLLGV